MAPATESRRQLHRWLAIGGLACLLAGSSALAAWRDDHAILINTTESLPNWAFFIDKARTPSRGDFVVFTPPATPIIAGHFGQKSAPFAKRVYGMPGDLVTREGKAVRINGAEVAQLKENLEKVNAEKETAVRDQNFERAAAPTPACRRAAGASEPASSIFEISDALVIAIYVYLFFLSYL